MLITVIKSTAEIKSLTELKSITLMSQLNNNVVIIYYKFIVLSLKV